jgi:chaperone required for assembly of F1-ATPase
MVCEANAFTRAGLMLATPLLGSLILAFALWKGYLTGTDALNISRIGENFQAETWGVDSEVAQKADDLHQQLLSLEAWFDCLKG